MSLDDLIRFEPNTLAKATDVDTNFQLLKSEINNILASISSMVDNISSIFNNKANITGDPTIPFNVGDATESKHAVNKAMLESYLGNFVYYIYGLDILKDSNDSTSIIVTSGQCYDETKQHKLVLDSDTSYQLTDAQANTTYNIYLFGNDTEGDVTVIFDQQSGQQPQPPSGYLYSRLIGNLTTDSNGDISLVKSFSNTAQSSTKVFNRLSITTSKNTRYNLTQIPNDGEVYYVWVYNKMSGVGHGDSCSVQTDIFPKTNFNVTDYDASRSSGSIGLVVVPVGSGRWITTSQKCSIIGYMRA